ncbi:MAG: SAM-dependent methyltransferase, partial [Pseudomonadota bacterium]
MADKARSKRRHGAADAADSPDDVSEPLAPGLYLLSTPIGAADDITIRGLEALRRADILACEDTRVLRRLMDLHGVPVGGRPMIAYHDHSSEDVRRRLLEDAATASVVYASDAGTPLIADPGYRLVVEARSRNLAVVALPGPSAVLAALTVSGLPTDRFCFGGFPPPKKSARQKWLR